MPGITIPPERKALIDHDKRAIRRVEVFKSGKHENSSVPERYFRPEEVQGWAREYNEQYPNRRAPAIPCHPKETEGKPSMGWANNFDTMVDPTELDCNGRPVVRLFADFADFEPAFFEAIAEGKYRERSLGLRGGKIHHVAWLGAELPAVKGLAPLEFGEDDPDAEELDISFKSQEGTDMAVSKEEIEAILKSALTPFEQRLAAIEKAKGKSADDKDDDKKKAAKPDGKKANFSEADDADPDEEGTPATDPQVLARLEALEKENAQLKGSAREAEFKEWLNSDEIRVRVEPAKRDEVLNTMRALDKATEELSFSEGDKTVKRTALEQYKQSVAKGPVVMHFGEYKGARDAKGKFADGDDPQKLGDDIAASVNPKTEKNGATA